MVKKTYLQEMPRTNYLNILVKPPEGDYGVIPERKKKGNMTAECQDYRHYRADRVISPGNEYLKRLATMLPL